MTIIYPNGTVRRAIVLSREEHEIRAAAAGCDDVLVFTRIQGTWISEELKPVTVVFELSNHRRSPHLSPTIPNGETSRNVSPPTAPQSTGSLHTTRTGLPIRLLRKLLSVMISPGKDSNRYFGAVIFQYLETAKI